MFDYGATTRVIFEVAAVVSSADVGIADPWWWWWWLSTASLPTYRA